MAISAVFPNSLKSHSFLPHKQWSGVPGAVRYLNNMSKYTTSQVYVKSGQRLLAAVFSLGMMLCTAVRVEVLDEKGQVVDTLEVTSIEVQR